jgi:hypothetical protein
MKKFVEKRFRRISSKPQVRTFTPGRKLRRKKIALLLYDLNKKKKIFLTYNKKRLLRRRIKWRRMPRLVEISHAAVFDRLLFFFWRVLPFLVETKKFLIELFVRLENKKLLTVYMMNASKFVAVDAGMILNFVVNFLKRRRRITKINKIFYRMMRIIRFFKARYKLRGFKLLLAGRFLRRDRATYI